MLQIVICDDEPDVVELISDRLDMIIKPIIEYQCLNTTKSREVIQFAEEINIDLLLIDIEMPEMNGFEIVEQIKKENRDMIVIFVTNMDLYVYESLKYRPFRFIRKSHLEEIEEAILSAVLLFRAKNEKLDIHINGIQNITVKIADIIYFESYHNDIRLTTVNGEYTYRSTLKAIEKELEGKGFVRIHSGYLLNIKYIHVIKKTDVEICFSGSRKELPISRGNRNNLILEYNKSLR